MLLFQIPFYAWFRPASVMITSPAIISPAQEGTQDTLAGTLRRPGGGAYPLWSVTAGSSGDQTTRW